MLAASQQIGSFSFASPLQWCSDSSPRSPFKGEEILLTLPAGFFLHQQGTLAKFEQVW